jgi:hypothetical protein
MNHDDSFWNAIDELLAHYGPDEERDFNSTTDAELQERHIYHALERLRCEPRTPPPVVDVSTLLESRGQIAIIWSTEDVLSVRPQLSADQAWDVLVRCERIHDCNYGFTWELLEAVADDLYPAADIEDKPK